MKVTLTSLSNNRRLLREYLRLHEEVRQKYIKIGFVGETRISNYKHRISNLFSKEDIRSELVYKYRIGNIDYDDIIPQLLSDNKEKLALKLISFINQMIEYEVEDVIIKKQVYDKYIKSLEMLQANYIKMKHALSDIQAINDLLHDAKFSEYDSQHKIDKNDLQSRFKRNRKQVINAIYAKFYAKKRFNIPDRNNIIILNDSNESEIIRIRFIGSSNHEEYPHSISVEFNRNVVEVGKLNKFEHITFINKFKYLVGKL